jgi:hypothetical protein
MRIRTVLADIEAAALAETAAALAEGRLPDLPPLPINS